MQGEPPVKSAFSEVKYHDLIFDLVGRKITCNGKKLRLRRKEFQLLRHLVTCSDNGEVGQRSDLMAFLYGAESRTPTIVNVYVNSVRRQLEKSGSVCYVKTVRKVGYRLLAGSPDSMMTAA